MPYRPLSVLLTHWNLEPTVLAGLIVLTAAYFSLERQPRFGVPTGRKIGFVWAIAALALALLSPLDEISDSYLFSAHMLQHLILVLIAAPLLVRAMPQEIGRRLRVPPLVAFSLFNLIFTFSHIPVWYNLMLQNELLHSLEHVAYVVTAMLTWLPVANPARELRLSSGLQMLYLFLQTLPMFLLGALLSLDDSALYRSYVYAPRILPISPVEDQSLGGLIMWIGGSFFYLGALTFVFFRWANVELASANADEPEQAQTAGPEHQQLTVKSYG